MQNRPALPYRLLGNLILAGTWFLSLPSFAITNEELTNTLIADSVAYPTGASATVTMGNSDWIMPDAAEKRLKRIEASIATKLDADQVIRKLHVVHVLNKNLSPYVGNMPIIVGGKWQINNHHVALYVGNKKEGVIVDPYCNSDRIFSADNREYIDQCIRFEYSSQEYSDESGKTNISAYTKRGAYLYKSKSYEPVTEYALSQKVPQGDQLKKVNALYSNFVHTLVKGYFKDQFDFYSGDCMFVAYLVQTLILRDTQISAYLGPKGSFIHLRTSADNEEQGIKISNPPEWVRPTARVERNQLVRPPFKMHTAALLTLLDGSQVVADPFVSDRLMPVSVWKSQFYSPRELSVIAKDQLALKGSPQGEEGLESIWTLRAERFFATASAIAIKSPNDVPKLDLQTWAVTHILLNSNDLLDLIPLRLRFLRLITEKHTPNEYLAYYSYFHDQTNDFNAISDKTISTYQQSEYITQAQFAHFYTLNSPLYSTFMSSQGLPQAFSVMPLYDSYLNDKNENDEVNQWKNSTLPDQIYFSDLNHSGKDYNLVFDKKAFK